MAATLSALSAALDGASLRGEGIVTDATHDSRQAGPGVLFCAIPGARTDGHDHAPGAVDAGTEALLVERWLDLEVPQIRVPDSRAATGPAAAVVHGRPSDHLQVIGITGTNGKTTTAYLAEGAMAAAGWGTGLIGTVETRVHGEAIAGVRTTPEGTDIQRLLARMLDRGVQGVAMEVSSHGLSLHRIDGTRVAVAVFTNLSQDHLDFHPSMQAYLEAKARLFTQGIAERGIAVVADEWGRRLVELSRVPTTTVGPGRDTDVHLEIVDAGLDGTTVRLTGPGELLGTTGPVEVSTGLLGGFNGWNAATAYLAAVAAGVPADAAVAGIAACPGAPGRLERVEAGQDATVLVDYAHTPDAVATMLGTLRPLLQPGGRLVVVLGAGGDRDRGKRPLMGAAATAADIAVLTSDNPRTEDPGAILAEVERGAREAAGAEVIVEPDRRRAIAAALDRAGPHDVVVVAGKGHETTQDLGTHVVPFDDRRVAAQLLAGRVDRGGIGGAA